MSQNLVPMLILEALGPAALCFFSIGAVIATQGQDLVAISIATGMAFAILVAVAGNISGAHFNPATTLSMLATGHISVPDAVAYIAAQLAGALLGTAALTLTFVDVDRNRVNMGLPAVGQSIVANPPINLSSGNALVMEIILTFTMVLVIFGTAVEKRSLGRWIAPLAIGLSITIGGLVGSGVSGAAMNPARWFGPAVVQQDFTNGWIWIVGPIIGALAAGLLYQYVIKGMWVDEPVAAPAGKAAQARVVEIDEADVIEQSPAAPVPQRRNRRKK